MLSDQTENGITLYAENVNGDILIVIMRNIALQQRQVQDNAVRQEQLHQLVHPRVIITTGTKVTTTMATCDRPQQVANIQSTSEPAVSEEMMAVPSYSYTSRPQEISQEISQQLVSESSWSAQQLVPESSSSALSNSQPSPQHTSQTQVESPPISLIPKCLLSHKREILDG